MLLLMLAAIIGGILTLVSLWPFGIVIALACAPIGGSLAAFITALLLAWYRSHISADLETAGRSTPAEPSASRESVVGLAHRSDQPEPIQF